MRFSCRSNSAVLRLDLTEYVSAKWSDPAQAQQRLHVQSPSQGLFSGVSPSAEMVKERKHDRVRLFVRGRVLGYKRSKSNQYENTSLVQIEGVNTKEEVDWYLGKRLAYIYKCKTKKNDSNVRCIWGKVTRPHGNSGVVRAKFKTNLPPKSMVRMLVNCSWSKGQSVHVSQQYLSSQCYDFVIFVAIISDRVKCLACCLGRSNWSLVEAAEIESSHGEKKGFERELERELRELEEVKSERRLCLTEEDDLL
ncbi:hypothetical protein ZIOFF_031514 [Zingiber officinale]|uniref:Ribosomal protein L35A n=1 Tax=Zingiber officinale TaxID=94328 RepID=A0A8J5LAV0_ZINOF|nr:hypothetical protein ZIOFF_031514 [Zingiber officinale]